MVKKLFLLLLLQAGLFSYEVDVIVFSYDRPLQIYAFLESLFHHSSHIHGTSVLYRCSNLSYRAGYEEVMTAFPQATFIEQTNPPHDFKPLLLQEMFKAASSEYVVFAVDDMIVTDEVDFDECIGALEKTKAYGFYLRLGQNIDDCWSSGLFEGIPSLSKVSDKIFSWVFKTGIGNWAYPNTVDMTIYRKKDLEKYFNKAPFFHPNSLEDHFGEVNLELMGLCYETSRAVNIPMNIVSETTATRHLHLSAKELHAMFDRGLKLDISPLFQYKNRSSHVFNYNPTFVQK